MADTKYTYSISSDFPNGQVDSDTLTEQINDSSISSADLIRVDTSGDVCDIWFDDPLSSGDETTLDGIVAAHTGFPDISAEKGGLVIYPLDTPSAPTVTPQGTPGSTTWGYKVSAFSGSGETLAFSEGTTSTGAATLNDTDFNRVSWPHVDTAVKYAVYRSTAGGTPSSTGKVIEVSGDVTQFDDNGKTASGAEPSEDRSSALSVGYASETTGKLLNVQEQTTDDNTVTSLITLFRESLNTVLAGFGTGIYVKLNDEDDTVRSAGSMHVLWEDPSTALETAFRIMLRDGGSQTVERFRVTHDGSIELSGNTVIDQGTCRKVFPVDGGIRGGTTSGSTNNDIAAIRFDNLGDGWNRINFEPPTRYVSGDLVFRLYCSVPSSVAVNKGTRWRLNWSLKDIGDALGSWGYTNEYTYDISSQSSDEMFAIDFTIQSSQFDKAKELLAMKITRLGTHADDDCNVHVYVHGLELRFYGFRFAGQ